MSGRVSWQRLALIRGQLTERDWAVMAMLTCVKLANGNATAPGDERRQLPRR